MFPHSHDLRLLTFSFLSGDELFKKIAVLNKKLRQSLPGAGLLDQHKSISIKCTDCEITDEFALDSFLYAVSLADSFQVTLLKDNLASIKKFFFLIKVAN